MVHQFINHSVKSGLFKIEDLSEFSDLVTDTFAEKLKHTVEHDMWDEIGREHFRSSVEFFTSRGQPLEAVLPAFPCKSSNYEKCLVTYPIRGGACLAEVITFR